MRYVIIKKASQNEQQNQTTTTTTNINYIKNFISIFLKKNLTTKSRQRQIQLKLKEITCISPEEKWDQSIIRLCNNYTIKNKNSKVEKFAYFL